MPPLKDDAYSRGRQDGIIEAAGFFDDINGVALTTREIRGVVTSLKALAKTFNDERAKEKTGAQVHEDERRRPPSR